MASIWPPWLPCVLLTALLSTQGAVAQPSRPAPSLPPKPPVKTLPEVLLQAHYAYRQTLALLTCLRAEQARNISCAESYNANTYENIPLFPEKHFHQLDENFITWQTCTGTPYWWSAANLTTALNGIKGVLAQALLAECGLAANCTSWRTSQANPLGEITAALDAGQAQFVSYVAQTLKDPRKRFCPFSDLVGLFATAIHYPGIGDKLGGLRQWIQALIGAGQLTPAEALQIYRHEAVRLVGKAGYDRLEQLSQLLIHFSLSPSLLEKLKARWNRRSLLQEVNTKEKALEMGKRRLKAADTCSWVKNRVALYSGTPTLCSEFSSQAGLAALESTSITVGSQKLGFIAAQITMYQNVAKAVSFENPNTDAALGSTIASMLALRPPGASIGLSKFSIAGLACAIPIASAPIMADMGRVCAKECSRGACEIDVFNGYGNWGAFLVPTASDYPQPAPSPPYRPPPVFTGNTTTLALPNAVLEAHYSYRRVLAQRRCLAGSTWNLFNCSLDFYLNSYEGNHLYFEDHLVMLDKAGRLPQGQSCGPLGGGGVQYGWTAANLTSVLQNMSYYVPQVLLIECNLTAACRAWRDSQPNPAGLIQAAVRKGMQNMLGWLSKVDRVARFCPKPDPGGIHATAATFPSFDNPLYKLNDWPAALFIGRKLDATGMQRVMKLHSFKPVFHTSTGLDRIEEMQSLLIHFSLSSSLLAKLRQNNPRLIGRRLFQAGGTGVGANLAHPIRRRKLLQGICQPVKDLSASITQTKTLCGSISTAGSKYGTFLQWAEKGAAKVALKDGSYLPFIASQIVAHLDILKRSSGPVRFSDEVQLALDTAGLGQGITSGQPFIVGTSTATGTAMLAAATLAGADLACSSADVASTVLSLALKGCGGRCDSAACTLMGTGSFNNWLAFPPL